MLDTPELRIVTDLDDVLSSTAQGIVDYSNQTWGCGLQLEDFHENLPRLWGVDRTEATGRWLQFCEERLPVLPPQAGAPEAVARLSRDARFDVLTSRRKAMGAMTVGWIGRLYPNIRSVGFANIDWDNDPQAHTRTKSDDLETSGQAPPDIFIDDQPKHCIAVALLGVRTVLFGNYPWNRGVDVPPNVTSISTWPVLEEYIGETAEELAA